MQGTASTVEKPIKEPTEKCQEKTGKEKSPVKANILVFFFKILPLSRFKVGTNDIFLSLKKEQEFDIFFLLVSGFPGLPEFDGTMQGAS